MNIYKEHAPDIQPLAIQGQSNKMIAACGNDCFACPRYTAHPFEKAEEELKRTAELWMTIGYRDRIVSTDEISCAGCRPETRCRYGIKLCCKDKGIQVCAECRSYPCARTLESLVVTGSFRPACRKACTEEEYKLIEKAFFEKAENLKPLSKGKMTTTHSD